MEYVKSFFGVVFLIFAALFVLMVISVFEYAGMRTLLPSVGLHAPDYWTVFWSTFWSACSLLVIAVVAGIINNL
jgi:ABC-type Fe3+ transport system permease subunit